MAITMEELKATFDAVPLRTMQVGSEALLTGVAAENLAIKLAIGLYETGEYLTIRTMSLATIAVGHPARSAVMAVLNRINKKYSGPRFAIDPEDGEIYADISLAIEDATSLSVESVRFLLAGIIMVVGAAMLEVQPLLDRRTSVVQRAPAVDRPVSALDRPRSPGMPATRPANMVASVGVLLLGIAAIAGVIYLFIH